MTTKKPSIITISGSSGGGKSTIVRELLELKLEAKLITSYTNRGPRASDLPGEYMCNVSPEYFEEHKDEFLWVVSAHGNTYGTTKSSVREALDSPGLWIMILIPPVVELLRKSVAEMTDSEDRVLSFYVRSPGEAELKRRLLQREDNPVTIQKRIEDAANAEKFDKLALESDLPYIFLTNNEPDIGPIKAAEKILSYIS